MTTALASSTVEHTSAAPPLAKPIYDVVQLVRPGTPCSTPPGRWHTGVAFWTAKAAREIVAVYNRHISDQIPPGGIRYTVERHDSDTCPGRARDYRDRDKSEDVTCTCKQDVCD